MRGSQIDARKRYQQQNGANVERRKQPNCADSRTARTAEIRGQPKSAKYEERH
jgi:hypothetical protein